MSHGPDETLTIIPGYECPTLVDVNVRTNTDFPGSLDSFTIEQYGQTIIVTRVGGDKHWGMELSFECCAAAPIYRYEWQFNNCCRGGATSWTTHDTRTHSSCETICNSQESCHWITTVGWNSGDANPAGTCYTFLFIWW
eukprot:UN29565